MSRRSPPRKVAYFEPVLPRLARNTIIERISHAVLQSTLAMVKPAAEAATITFTLRRAVHGSRFNGRCQVTAHTAARPCTIWRRVKGSFRARGKPGLNRLHFSGRINHHALAPGTYRLVLRAQDQAGRASDLVRVRFSISD